MDIKPEPFYRGGTFRALVIVSVVIGTVLAVLLMALQDAGL